jgi:hypothetical protein
LQAQARNTQVSVLTQHLSQFLANQNVLHLDTVYGNELKNIDLQIKQLQIAYLNTILLSPISGTVTGIYKNSGDWVSAGEPVIRVENNSSIILVGTVVFPEQISNGMQAKITMTSVFDSPNAKIISGAIISTRGHPNKDDRWDLHVLCDNSTDPVLPPDYSFDFDNTEIDIS